MNVVNQEFAPAKSGDFRPSVSDADWSEIRRTTLAAHELPALFTAIADVSGETETGEEYSDQEGRSLNAYASPLSLWAMKTGSLVESGQPRPRSLWSRLKWGLIDQLAEEHGLETRRPRGVLIHPHLPMMSSRVDVEASDDGGASWIPMVAFNIPGGSADTWRNAVGEWVVPESVILQMHHHMAVSGADRALVAVMFGGSTTRLLGVERDDELIVEIEHAILDFWSFVTEKRRPNSTGARDAAILARLTAMVDPQDAVIDKRDDLEFLSLIDRRSSLSSERGKLDKEIKEINSRLNEIMAGTASAIVSETQQLSWVRTQGSQVSYWRSPSARLQLRKLTDRCAGTPAMDLSQKG